MSRGKYQAPRRKLPVTLWVILLFMIIGISVGGTRAYLSYSAGPAANEFVQDNNPQIHVDEAYRVTVETNYDVYLRAAVVANWTKENGDIIAEVPELGTDYTVSGDWKLINGFYYYKKAVTNGETTSAIIAPKSSEKNGYTLQMNVAVQAIQAVGTTDAINPTGAKDAVEDAWGVATAEFLRN